MKVQRFFAEDMRRAINQVRETLGPDAVILSNKMVDGGVEIIAAVEYQKAEPQAMPMPAVVEKAPANLAPKVMPKAKADEFDALWQEDQVSFSRQAQPAIKAASVNKPTPARANPVVASEQRQSAQQLIRELSQAHANSQVAARTLHDAQPDPALQEMKKEMQFLRSLLETQMSGLAQRELQLNNPVQAVMQKRLGEMGLTSDLAQQIVRSIGPQDNEEQAFDSIQRALAQRIPVNQDDIVSKGGIVALLGPTGVGKTTTLAKLAARFAMKYGASEVALVSTDCYRIAAHEQLRTYGRIIGCTVRIVEHASQLRETLEQLYDKRLVLIDTAGMSQKDLRLAEQLETFSIKGIRNYLVLSATAQQAVLEDSLRAFKNARLTGCILTKLDESLSLGESLSAVIRQRLPISYLADGQRVPEDLRPARPGYLVSQAVARWTERQQQLLTDYAAG